MDKMNFIQSEEKIQSISRSLKEWKSQVGAGLLQDKIKKEIIELYDMVSNMEESISIKEEILLQTDTVQEKVEMKSVEEITESVEEIEEVVNEKTIIEEEPLLEDTIQNQENEDLSDIEEEDKKDPFDLFNDLLSSDEVLKFNENNQKEYTSKDIIEASEEIVEDVHIAEVEEKTIVEKLRVPLQDKIEEFKSKPIQSLNNSIPIGKKFEFIEDLFIGNSDEYNRAISDIDVMPDYKQAEEYLMINYFDKFSWMEKEKVLNNLFDFITRRFAA